MKTLLFALALCTASVAHANEAKKTPNQAEDAVKTASANDDDRMVCERKKKLGSNMVERVCTTAAQRDAAKKQAQNDLDRLGRCSGNDSICSGSL